MGRIHYIIIIVVFCKMLVCNFTIAANNCTSKQHCGFVEEKNTPNDIPSSYSFATENTSEDTFKFELIHINNTISENSFPLFWEEAELSDNKLTKVELLIFESDVSPPLSGAGKTFAIEKFKR